MKKPRQGIKQEIIDEIAREDGGSRTEIGEIVDVQFEYLADIIRTGGFEGVRLPYFGTFWAKPARVQHVNEEAIKRRLEKDGLIQSGKPSSSHQSGNKSDSGDPQDNIA